MIEMESSKDFETKFFDNEIVCFFSEKLYWKTIDGLAVENNGYPIVRTFLENTDEIVKMYFYRKYSHKPYLKYDESLKQYVKKKDEELGEFVEEVEEPLETYDEAVKHIKKWDIRVEFFKQTICCPCCHKVHTVEKFMVIKKEKEDEIKKVEERYGNDWFMLFYYEDALDKANYFEGEYKRSDEFCFIRNLDTCFSPDLICPDCNTNVRDYKFKRLNVFNKVTEENVMPKAFTIFKDEKKVALSILFGSFYMNVDAEKLALEDFRVRLTFNTVSGQSYFVGAKKLNGKRLKNFYPGSLQNITYRIDSSKYNNYVWDVINNPNVKKKLLLVLLESHGGSIELFKNAPKKDTEFLLDLNQNGDIIQEEESFDDLLDSIDFKSFDFSWLTTYNRIPNAGGDFVMNLYKSNSAGYNFLNDTYYIGKILRKTTVSSSKDEILKQIIKNTGLPSTKKVRKLIINDVSQTRDLLEIKHMGFKDINIIYRFLDLEKSHRDIISNMFFEGYSLKDVQIFSKDMIKKKGEPKTFNTFFGNSNTADFIIDAARMYVKFKNSDMVLKEYFNDDIKKIHDRMSKDIDKIRFSNVEISYKKSEEIYNMMVDGFEFRLAKDTNELVKIGQELKICVGGYRDVAIEKSSIIVSVVKDDKYHGCIEVSPNGKYLKQAKAVYNNVFQEHKAQALQQWVETLGINADDCCDYRHIKEGNISFDENIYLSRTYDYHNLELDAEGNVIPKNANNDFDDEEYPFN